MKYAFRIILIAITVFACKKDFSPILTDIAVYYSGQDASGQYEFRLVNNSDDPLWYWGDKSFVVYSISVYDGSKWNDAGPWWCGTGLEMSKLESGGSVTFKISNPNEHKLWRLGVQIYYSVEGESEFIWSQEIK